MLLDLAAGEQVLAVENGCYALVALLALLILRIWIYYHFQKNAMEIAAPLIRKAICAYLYGGKQFSLPFPYGFRTDLQMIFDLTRWSFKDFYPSLAREE